ncbi:MAG TPA: alpha/beta fold hydrolase [Rhodopila sp.]|uniref:thioesterase domain-containing protein n=1 Tax=Rhodopila sp. TaxID=2480087 RepID=UPI002C99AF69|nr:alpha/beta fold hydrolase [Rhodopila sp.]HVY17342.1 alpha/beta fold hydrolase [Rhodopila sp.]
MSRVAPEITDHDIGPSDESPGEGPGKGAARIVAFKPGQPGPAFFLVPGTGGRIEGFADLANHLDTTMPVYGIEARGVDDDSEPDDDLDELVDHYLEQVTRLQPHGPYFLLGHSFGGMVVFEMAQRLLKAGQPIGCLIMLDTLTPKPYWPLSFWMVNIRERMRQHAVRLFTNHPKTSFAYYSRRYVLKRRGLEGIPEDLQFGKDGARMLLANEMLLKRWKPFFYPGKLTLFCAADTKDLSLLWHDLVKELDYQRATGTHIGLIKPPYVASLAHDISRSLSAAATGPAT